MNLSRYLPRDRDAHDHTMQAAVSGSCAVSALSHIFS